jgi:hypothetical protein
MAREPGEIEKIRFPGKADEYARKAGRSASSPSSVQRSQLADLDAVSARIGSVW